MKIQGQEPIAFNDFSNEIFDMVRPKRDSNRIYIEDLLSRFNLVVFFFIYILLIILF